MEKKILVFENKVLRKICGPVLDPESGLWRRRYNKELRQMTGQEEISVFIKCQRLKWAGHLARMDCGEYPKRAFLNEEDGKRSVGRPRLRWRDGVKEDAGREDWREVAEDRKEWINLIEEAKNRL